jgi:hypothetical protein
MLWGYSKERQAASLAHYQTGRPTFVRAPDAAVTCFTNIVNSLIPPREGAACDQTVTTGAQERVVNAGAMARILRA